MPHHARATVGILTQLLVLGLVISLLALTPRTFTAEQAAQIEIGTSQRDVETFLGPPTSLHGYVFCPQQVARDNDLFVDNMTFLPNHFPLGPGLTSYTLHSRQEECWTDTGPDKYNWRCSFWIGHDCSIVVFYSPTYHVEKVYALRTTVHHANPWDYVKWRWQKLFR